MQIVHMLRILQNLTLEIAVVEYLAEAPVVGSNDEDHFVADLRLLDINLVPGSIGLGTSVTTCCPTSYFPTANSLNVAGGRGGTTRVEHEGARYYQCGRENGDFANEKTLQDYQSPTTIVQEYCVDDTVASAGVRLSTRDMHM